MSVFQDGRTKSVYVPRSLEGEVRRWVENAQKVQADVLEITRLNAELLRRARAAEGRAGHGPAAGARRPSGRSRG